MALPEAVYKLSNQHLTGVYEPEAPVHLVECVNSFISFVYSYDLTACVFKVILKLFTVKSLGSCRIPEMVFEVGFHEETANIMKTNCIPKENSFCH